MEFKRVSEESYESVCTILEMLFSLNDSIQDFMTVEYNGSKFYLSIGYEGIAVIEERDKELYEYMIPLHENDVEINVNGLEKFCVDGVAYTKHVVNGNVVAQKENLLNKNRSQLIYLPASDNNPRSYLEYIEYLDRCVAMLKTTYDVTTRNTLGSSLMYTNYHNPDLIQLKAMRRGLLASLKIDRKTFIKKDSDEVYYKPLLHIDNMFLGTRRTKYDSSILIEQLKENGFNFNIESDLSSLLEGTNKERDLLNCLTTEYKRELKRQK